jgi:hypothetical protein
MISKLICKVLSYFDKQVWLLLMTAVVYDFCANKNTTKKSGYFLTDRAEILSWMCRRSEKNQRRMLDVGLDPFIGVCNIIGGGLLLPKEEEEVRR